MEPLVLRIQKGQSCIQWWENEATGNVKYLIGGWGGGGKLNVESNLMRWMHSQAQSSNTPRSVCTRKELSSVFSLSPSGQSSNHSSASWVKSINAAYVFDDHPHRRSWRSKRRTLSQSCNDMPMTSLFSHTNAPRTMPKITSFITSQTALLKLWKRYWTGLKRSCGRRSPNVFCRRFQFSIDIR